MRLRHRGGGLVAAFLLAALCAAAADVGEPGTPSDDDATPIVLQQAQPSEEAGAFLEAREEILLAALAPPSPAEAESPEGKADARGSEPLRHLVPRAPPARA